MGSAPTLPITEVVVHRDGALVHRRGRADVGEHGIVVRGLPIVLDERTLRVEVIGATPSGWRLGVDVEGVDRGEESGVEQRLYAAKAALARLEAKDRALAVTREVVFRLQPGAPVRGEEPSSARVAGWAGVARDLLRWAEEIDDARNDLAEPLRLAREAVNIAQWDVTSSSSQERYRRWVPANRLEIAVAGGAATVEVAVSYRVEAAAWVPTYALFADAALRSARFLARALVAQSTGEDWTGVKLSFSTAPSARSIDVQELPALRLGKAQPPAKSPWRDLPPGLDALFPKALYALPQPPAVPEPDEVGAGEDVDLFVKYGLSDDAPAPAEKSPPKKSKAALRQRLASNAPAPPPPAAQAAPAGAAMPMSAPVAAPAPMATFAPQDMPRAKGGGLLSGIGSAAGALMEAVSEGAEELGGMAMRGGGGPPPPGAPLVRSAARPGLPGPLEVAVDLLDYGSLRLGGVDGPAHERGRLHPADPTAELGLPPSGRQALDLARTTFAAGRQRLRFDALPAHHVLPGPIDESDHRYDAPGTADVQSDARFHAVSVFEDTIALDVRYRSVPRADARAFRTVRAKLGRAIPLLAGPVDVHIDGALVLVAAWSGSAKGAEIAIGLGPEDGVKIVRNVRYREESAGLMGGYRRLHTEIEVDLASSLGRAAEIELLDRLPITDDPEITVELVSASPVADVYKGDEAAGTLVSGGRRQVVQLPPGGRVKAVLHYTVTLGSKLEIDGGERR